MPFRCEDASGFLAEEALCAVHQRYFLRTKWASADFWVGGCDECAAEAQLGAQVRALLPGRNAEIEQRAATRLSGMEAAIQREADEEFEGRLAGLRAEVTSVVRERAGQRVWEEVRAQVAAEIIAGLKESKGE
jgi:hypothetical protein